jgi:hypothetical protein
MNITVKCACGKEFSTSAENAGKKAKCSACGQRLDIPASALSADIESEIAQWLPTSTAEPTNARPSASPPPRIPDPPFRSTMPPVGASAAANSTAHSHGASVGTMGASGSVGVASKRSPSLQSNSWYDLFDWDFSNFITPQIVRSLYRLYLIVAAMALVGQPLGMYFFVFRGDERWSVQTYVYLIFVEAFLLVGLLLWLLVLRLFLEMVMVFFRSEEHLRELASTKG